MDNWNDATALIRCTMAKIEKHYPDDDPGDITITMQDDSDLVELHVVTPIDYHKDGTHYYGEVFLIGDSIIDVARKFHRWASLALRNES